MPLVRIDLLEGKGAAYKKAICDGVYQAIRETFNVPEEYRFMIVTEHDGDDFVFSRSYMGIAPCDALVVLQLTVSNTRTRAQKKALFARIVALLGQDPGLRPQDVFINPVPVTTEDWSFGDGIAQYVADQP